MSDWRNKFSKRVSTLSLSRRVNTKSEFLSLFKDEFVKLIGGFDGKEFLCKVDEFPDGLMLKVGSNYINIVSYDNVENMGSLRIKNTGNEEKVCEIEFNELAEFYFTTKYTEKFGEMRFVSYELVDELFKIAFSDFKLGNLSTISVSN